jgi:hypothetical protein
MEYKRQKLSECLQQKNCLEGLAKEISEAKREITSIHNEPYPSTLGTEINSSGLDTVRVRVRVTQGLIQ